MPKKPIVLVYRPRYDRDGAQADPRLAGLGWLWRRCAGVWESGRAFVLDWLYSLQPSLIEDLFAWSRRLLGQRDQAGANGWRADFR